MPFTPNDYILDQLITLSELWRDRVNEPQTRLKGSMSTKKFLSMIRGGLTKEMLVKYWENVPALRDILDKPNFDQVAVKPEPEPESDDQTLDDIPPADEQSDTDLAAMPMEPAPAQPMPEPAELEPQAQPVGPGPKDIVSKMAARRRGRVMEQARMTLRSRSSLVN